MSVNGFIANWECKMIPLPAFCLSLAVVDRDQWILTGLHTVNRICYLITEISHDWRDIQFRIPARGYSLTRLGLLRQTNKLGMLMVAS